MISPAKYASKLSSFTARIEEFYIDQVYPHALECMFESCMDCSLFYTLDEVKTWFKAKQIASSLQVTEIPLSEIRDWSIDKTTGNIYHSSHDFFKIHGVRVESRVRETTRGWDQPIITQVGFDGGILGLIRKRFEGVPHYLCEAKEEPGNYGKIQLSPTIQATFANLNQKHGGREPHFSDLFGSRDTDPSITVLFESWLAEDGGRLYLKRNKGILVEIDEDSDVPLPSENFIWLSLYQIKALLKEDAWINPHIRGILAHV